MPHFYETETHPLTFPSLKEQNIFFKRSWIPPPLLITWNGKYMLIFVSVFVSECVRVWERVSEKLLILVSACACVWECRVLYVCLALFTYLRLHVCVFKRERERERERQREVCVVCVGLCVPSFIRSTATLNKEGRVCLFMAKNWRDFCPSQTSK